MNNQANNHTQKNHPQTSYPQTESNMFLQNISSINQTTMSSREIAQLCEKRHDHVLRDIRAYVGAVVKMERGIDVKSMDWGNEEGVHLFGETLIKGVTLKHEMNHQNKQYYPVCYLDKNTTLTIISGYNVLLRKRIIERWSELESQVASPVVPQSLPEALRLAADLAERVEQQQAQLAIAEPKALVYDTIVERTTLLNATQVGSKIGLTAQKLNKLLSVANVYDKRIKRSKTFSSWFVEKGLGEMKQTASGYPQALFTTKGEAWVVENFGIEEA